MSGVRCRGSFKSLSLPEIIREPVNEATEENALKEKVEGDQTSYESTEMRRFVEHRVDATTTYCNDRRVLRAYTSVEQCSIKPT